MKKQSIPWIILTILAILAGSCSSPAATVAPVEVSGQTEPMEEKVPEEPVETITEPELADEVIIGVGRDLYYGNTQWHIIHGSLMVWEPLVYPDENLNPQPYLAASWEPNEDKTEWTFHLRDGITFHDGTLLTADVAVQNLMGIHENYTPLPTLDSMEVIDGLTFSIRLTEPTPALADLMVFFQSAMLSPASFEQAESETPVPFGTGPYKFGGLLADDSIVLEKNEDYWGEPARTERIIYSYIPDATTRLQALQSGEIDAIADVGCIQPSQAEIILGDETLMLLTQEVLTTHYLFFNNDKPPFDNQMLRQAVSLALNREQIVEETVYGYGVPGASMITQLAEAWVYPEAAPQTDLQQAQELAETVLGDDRITVSLLVNSGLAGRWPYGEIAQIIQYELADLGIDVEIEMVEGGTWNDRLADDDYNMSMRPYTMSSGDPDDFMTYWARPDGIFNTKYSIGYENREVLDLISSAVSETDPSERKASYDQIQELLLEQAPFTPIYHEVTLYATRSNIYGLALDAVFRPTLNTVYKVIE